MTDVTAYAAAAVFLLFAAYRFSAAGGDATQRYIYAFSLCVGSALVLNAPASVAALYAVVQARAPIVAVEHGLKMGAFTCIALISLTLRASTADRTPVRRHIAAGLAVQVVSGWMFAASFVTVTPDAVTVGDGRRVLFAGYELLFAVYGIGCLAMLVGALAGHVRREANGVLRTGLVLMALSACVGILWTGWSAHDITEVLLHGRQGLGEDLPSTSFSVAVALLAAGGASATRWPVLLGGPLRWWRAHRSYRALEPLWAALCKELPEIALHAGTPRRRPHPRRATFALYRRVIEIRDAHLALRPYFEPVPPVPPPAASAPPAASTTPDAPSAAAAPGASSAAPAPAAASASTAAAAPAASSTPAAATAPPVPSPDAGGRGVAGQAALEAAAITAALANRRSGRRPDAAATDAPAPWPVAGTLDAETAWLLQVTRAFVRTERASR